MAKVYVASDHAGFNLKSLLVPYIGTFGHEVQDLGPAEFTEGDDYPQTIAPCVNAVAGEVGSFGIIIGKSGEGEAMDANRAHGVRAGVYYGGPLEIVKLLRKHNDANILSLGAGFLDPSEAQEAVQLFLQTAFSGDERHKRRIAEF